MNPVAIVIVLSVMLALIHRHLGAGHPALVFAWDSMAVGLLTGEIDMAQPQPIHRLGILREIREDRLLLVDTDHELADDLRKLPYVVRTEDWLDGRFLLTISPRYDYDECVAAIREVGDGL